MEHREQIKKRIEDMAKAMGLEPSTVGAKTGQGGKFYSRLVIGCRVWPETAASSNAKLDEFEKLRGIKFAQ